MSVVGSSPTHSRACSQTAAAHADGCGCRLTASASPASPAAQPRTTSAGLPSDRVASEAMNGWTSSGVRRVSDRISFRTRSASAGIRPALLSAHALRNRTHSCRAADRNNRPRGNHTPKVPNPRNGVRPNGAAALRSFSSPAPSGVVRSWAT